MDTKKLPKNPVVLSLFNGMECISLALRSLNVEPSKMYVSEIDPHANAAAKNAFPDSIHLGDVRNVRAWDLGHIDLVVAGSPCQGFSFAGRQLKFDDPRSKLFFEFARILEEAKAINPNVVFLLENVKMDSRSESVITNTLGVSPLKLNSSLLVAQDRPRLYWTNIMFQPLLFGVGGICTITGPAQKKYEIQDFVSPDGAKLVKESDLEKWKARQFVENNRSQFWPGKTGFLRIGRSEEAKRQRAANMANGLDYSSFAKKQIVGIRFDRVGCLVASGVSQHILYDVDKDIFRHPTLIECCRFQGVPDSFFCDKNGNFVTSEAQAVKMLGNGWTVPMIAHMLSFSI